MKQKRTLVITLIFLLVFSLPAFAHEKKPKGQIFMGEVQEVQKSEKDNTLRVKAKGYIKGCKVYKEELIAIISEDTVLISEKCSSSEKDNKREKVNPKELIIDQGDTVCMRLDEAMTKSIPPQVGAKSIQITRPD